MTGAPNPDNNRMRRSERLKGKKNFALFARAKHYRGMFLRMVVVCADSAHAIQIEGRKVAFVVSKKIYPHAVDRNRLKRRLRELYKKCRNLLPSNIQIMIIALPEATSQVASFEALHADIKQLFGEIAKKFGDRRR